MDQGFTLQPAWKMLGAVHAYIMGVRQAEQSNPIIQGVLPNSWAALDGINGARLSLSSDQVRLRHQSRVASRRKRAHSPIPKQRKAWKR